MNTNEDKIQAIYAKHNINHPFMQDFIASEYYKTLFQPEALDRFLSEWIPQHPEYIYNPEFNGTKCQCGCPYERHFDSDDDMSSSSCKYCVCERFQKI